MSGAPSFAPFAKGGKPQISTGLLQLERKAANSARGTFVCMPVEKVFTVRIPDWRSSSPRMTMRRAVLSAASKDFFRRNPPSPSSIHRSEEHTAELQSPLYL